MTALGTLAKVEEVFRTTLSNCAAFQTFVGASTAADALERIHFDGLPDPVDGQKYAVGEMHDHRPCAIVYLDEDAGLVRHLVSFDDWSESGRLICRLLKTASEVIDDAPSTTDVQTFKEEAGEILDGLCDLRGQAGYTDFHTVTVAGPYCNEPQERAAEGAWLQIFLLLDFGDR